MGSRNESKIEGPSSVSGRKGMDSPTRRRLST